MATQDQPGPQQEQELVAKATSGVRPPREGMSGCIPAQTQGFWALLKGQSLPLL